MKIIPTPDGFVLSQSGIHGSLRGTRAAAGTSTAIGLIEYAARPVARR